MLDLSENARGQARDERIRRWRLKDKMEEKYVPPDWALGLSYIPSTYIQVVIVHHCNIAVLHAGKAKFAARIIYKALISYSWADPVQG